MKSITMLKLKLVDPPERVEEVALLCRKARNAASMDWLLRQRGKRETPKQKKLNKEGKPLSESTKIYHAVTLATPTLGSELASNIAGQVNSFLGAKIDWRKRDQETQQRKRKEAILDMEERPPFYTDKSVPIANKHATVVFCDSLSVHVTNVTRNGKGQVGLDFDISLKGLSSGIKRILHEIATGRKKLADSKVLYNDRKKSWYWYVPVSFESEQLDEEKVAVLMPTIGENKYENSFEVNVPGRKNWGVGDGRYLLRQVKRLITLRKDIGWRYKQRLGAGHGRTKVDAAVRKRRAQQANVITEYRRKLILDVVKQCEKGNCGILVYRQPTEPAREYCWFALNGLEWDWTRFLTDLKNACSRRGIKLQKKTLKKGDVTDEKDAA